MIVRAALLLALTAPAAMAQQPAADLATLRSCLAEADRDPDAERACVGKPSTACLDAPQATTTTAIGACFAAEAEAWAHLMAETLDSATAMAATLDALAADEAPPSPPAAPLLVASQRAWEAFRDADCALEVALWTDGSMRLVAGPQCAMQHTAARTLALMARRRAFENP